MELNHVQMFTTCNRHIVDLDVGQDIMSEFITM